MLRLYCILPGFSHVLNTLSLLYSTPLAYIYYLSCIWCIAFAVPNLLFSRVGYITSLLYSTRLLSRVEYTASLLYSTRLTCIHYLSHVWYSAFAVSKPGFLTCWTHCFFAVFNPAYTCLSCSHIWYFAFFCINYGFFHVLNTLHLRCIQPGFITNWIHCILAVFNPAFSRVEHTASSLCSTRLTHGLYKYLLYYITILKHWVSDISLCQSYTPVLFAWCYLFVTYITRYMRVL